MSESWVEGTYESGSDDQSGADQNDPVEPTDRSAPDEGQGEGVELGMGEGSSFEPEEDPGAPAV